MFHDIVLLILPPYTSHLSVAIFGTLRQHLVGALYGIMQTEISRLQKVEWLVGYAPARKKTMSKSNVLSAFIGVGLFPFFRKGMKLVSSYIGISDRRWILVRAIIRLST